MSETNNQYIKSASLTGKEITFDMEDGTKLTTLVENINNTCNFIGTYEEGQLFKSGEDEFPVKCKKIKGKINGDIVYTSDTNQMYVWLDNDWVEIASSYPDIDKQYTKLQTRYKKIIPHPTNCVNCGSLLHDYVCEACGTEHPSFEYIIEEE